MTYQFPVAPHYELPNGLQAIDVIANVDCFDGFCYGNVLKYILRAEHKDSYHRDLCKAHDYIGFLLNPPPSKTVDLNSVAGNLSSNVASAFLAVIMALRSPNDGQRQQFLREAADHLVNELQTPTNPNVSKE